MISHDPKKANEQADTMVLLTGAVVVGTFISLIANMVPLAICIAVGSIYAAKRVLTPAG
jgi:hypothetical protein